MAFVLLGVFVIGSASASAEPSAHPIFDGLMSLGPIHGPLDPEEYSWEVSLGEGQALQAVDDRHAEVYYTEDHQTAFSITATEAHDADGSTVPTSLGVSEGNVITLVVHHRAGNPVAGGVPFVYPVNPGPGWQGGFHTEVVVGPKDEQELREERERVAREEWEALRGAGEGGASEECLVPRLRGRSLKAAKRRLTKADCTIGKVKKPKGVTARTGRVVKQNPKPGVVLASGTAVRVTLGG